MLSKKNKTDNNKKENHTQKVMFKSYSTKLAGRDLTIETGKICGLANGSVVVKYGDTVVMVNVTAAKEPKEGIDFFPLSVDYEEKLYAVGKTPGSCPPGKCAALGGRVL